MIFFIEKLVSPRDSTFIFFLGNETQQTRDGEYLKHLPFKHFLPCDALNAPMSCQKERKNYISLVIPTSLNARIQAN